MPSELAGLPIRGWAAELPAEPAAPRSELPGDAIYLVVSPPINDAVHHDHPDPPRRGSTFAPEPGAPTSSDSAPPTFPTPAQPASARIHAHDTP